MTQLRKWPSQVLAENYAAGHYKGRLPDQKKAANLLNKITEFTRYAHGSRGGNAGSFLQRRAVIDMLDELIHEMKKGMHNGHDYDIVRRLQVASHWHMGLTRESPLRNIKIFCKMDGRDIPFITAVKKAGGWYEFENADRASPFAFTFNLGVGEVLKISQQVRTEIYSSLLSEVRAELAAKNMSQFDKIANDALSRAPEKRIEEAFVRLYIASEKTKWLMPTREVEFLGQLLLGLAERMGWVSKGEIKVV